MLCVTALRHFRDEYSPPPPRHRPGHGGPSDGGPDAEGGCGSHDPIDADPDDSPPRRSSNQRRYAWAALLKRVFAVDALTCPHCGAKREILAVITEPDAVRAILRCLGFDDRAPPPPWSAPAPPHPIDEDGVLVLFPGDEEAVGDLDVG